MKKFVCVLCLIMLMCQELLFGFPIYAQSLEDAIMQSTIDQIKKDLAAQGYAEDEYTIEVTDDGNINVVIVEEGDFFPSQSVVAAEDTVVNTASSPSLQKEDFDLIDLSVFSEDELQVLQTAISREIKKRRDGKRYENGELAYVETESGNYFFGVTKATILPKTDYRDAVYQITWECQNENFRTNSGALLGINEDVLTVLDSNGYLVAPMRSAWGDEWVNSYVSVAPGQKCVTSHTYIINDPSCEYLDVSLSSRGINCRIYIEGNSANVVEKSTQKEKNLEIGSPITISDNNGSYIFTIENAHFVDWPYAIDNRPQTVVVTLQGIVENIDYDGIYEGAVCTYEIANDGIIVTDQDGFALEFCDFSGGEDGLYEVGAHVKIGTKKRVSLPFYADLTCEKLAVSIGNSVGLEIPIASEKNSSNGNANSYTEEEINAIVNEILQYKNNDMDKAWELIETYSAYMTEEQICKVLISYGRWQAVKVVEDELKTYLKSPRSYHRYSGSVGLPSIQVDGTYKVEIELKYGATNSFGAEVTDDVTMYAYFSIDLDPVSVHFRKAELSAVDKYRFYK